MTQKKNPILEQIKNLEQQLEQGLLEGEDIVTHSFDVTIDCANPIVAGETVDLLGLLTAVSRLREITVEEDDGPSIEVVLDVIDVIINAYAAKRNRAIDSYITSRDTTEALIETAMLSREGTKLH
ncbi:hypothetical protein BN79_018 [Yersinia phage phiR2-01]|uniref:Uncharacterized protein n=1 Tax=Yersinia phage phiR2-01 TaxID=1206557 RepID=I7K2K4_9CAUD|nr:hypothetical protein BN79_018 [Yersinia phage phiR2-01]CCI88446.1 hypothetical protein BN79_018 [Yersinia phage phiR2-01]